MIPKFRVWDRKNKVMRDVKGLIWEETDLIGHCNLIAHCPPRGHEFNEWFTVALDGSKYQLMQSTGLKDINGVEIYGGYVITYKIDEGNGEETISATVGLRPPFNVKIPYRDYDETSIYYLTEEDTWDWEVIGNIYENEELLEENAE